MPDYNDVTAVFPLVDYAIVGVDTALEEFVIDGDQTARFLVDDVFTVIDSTGNDGEYTVASRTYASGPDETTIVVNEDITDATVDGKILHDEKADTLPITESHDDIDDRDAAAPDQYAGAHGQRLANELRALGKTVGQGLGVEIIDGGGLVVYHTGGTLIKGSGPPVDITPSKLTLTDNQTNYVEVDIAGTVSSNTSAFSTGKYPLAIVTTVAGDITSLVDKRSAIYLAEFAEANLDAFGPAFDSATELTISGGVVTRTQGVHRIDTEADAAADNLDTINGATVPTLLFIRAENAARVVTLKDGTGNLDLDGKDIVLDSIELYVILLYDDTTSTWIIAGGGGGGGVAVPSTDEAMVMVEGVAGDLQESAAKIDPTGNIYDLVSLNIGPDAVVSSQIAVQLKDDTMTLDSGTGDLSRFWIRDIVTTGGVSAATDAEYYGYRASVTFDESGGFFEEIFGANIDMRHNDGTMDRLYGVKGRLQMDGFGGRSPIIQTQFFGGHFDVNATGGVMNADEVALHSTARSDTASGATTLNGDVIGHESHVKADSGVAINADVYNHRLFGNLVPAVAGTAYELFLDGTGNWDFSIYQNDSYPNYLGGPLEVVGITTMSGGRSNGAPTELTIAAGVVTVTKGYHRVDTEADAASDDLDTINGGVDGEMLILRAENDARTVVLKDSTGNLALNGVDITLDDVDPAVLLQYDEILSKWILVGNVPVGGGAAWRFIDLVPGAWDYPAANPAPLDTDTGTNGTMKRHLFDDTTEEQIIAQIRLPSDLDSAGTVFFELYGYAVAAAASKNVEFTFYHSPKNDGENWDAAFSSKISGDLATDATQDQLDSFSWSETVATLGWAADDLVRIKIGRTAPSVNNLVGDYGLTHFRLKIPRA